MGIIRHKWFTVCKAILIVLISCNVHASGIFGCTHVSGSYISGSGSGPISWANWNERNEPGGVSCYIVQMTNTVTGEKEEGFGYGIGIKRDFNATSLVAGVTNEGYRYCPEGGYFIVPTEIINNTFIDKSKWTLIVKMKDWVVDSGDDFILDLWSQDTITIYGYASGVSIAARIDADSGSNGGDTGSIYVNKPPSGTEIYMYLWNSGVSVGFAWSTSKETTWDSIPKDQKNTYNGVILVEDMPSLTYNGIGGSSYGPRQSPSKIKYIWFSNSCEIN